MTERKTKIYLIGSLRNEAIPEIGAKLRDLGFDVFDDWYAAGPEADDYWKKYEEARGRDYATALRGYAAEHVFFFDHTHLNSADLGLLILPAGRSGHLELGYLIGLGKPGFILLDHAPKLPDGWEWVAGLYEGEGSLTRNGKRNGHGMQLTITMRDEDIIRRAHSVVGVGSVEGPYKRDNPKWSDMWRLAIRRREDVLYVVNGLYPLLGERRREQVDTVTLAAGINKETITAANSPWESRWDIMYRFATGVFFNDGEMYDTLAPLA